MAFSVLFVIGLIALALRHNLEERRAAAAVDSANLVHLLESGLSASFDRIDLALEAVVDEHRRASSTGSINGDDFRAFLARQKKRAPDLLTLWTSDAQGLTRFNALEILEQVFLADRDFFSALRADPGAGLFVSKPYMGRIVPTPVMVFSRRLSNASGEFAGVVTGSVELARLKGILEAVDVGQNGVIALRWSDLSLVARKGIDGKSVPFGDTRVSPGLSQRVAAGASQGTFISRSAVDGAERTYSFRRLERLPLYVVVGLAPEDFLEGWRRQVGAALLLGACFILVTLASGWYGLSAWRRRLDHEQLLQEKTERLRESDERFRIAFQTSPDSINLNRVSDGVYVAVNEGFTRMTGYTEAEVIAQSSLNLGIWVDPNARARLVRGLERDGFVENLEAHFRRKDGSTLVGLMSARLIQVQGDTLLLSITRDVTEWKRAEEERNRLRAQVQQAQRLEGLGRLAGGVAHDFNNLLTVILSCCEAMREGLPSGGPQLEDVNQIQAAGERARDLTRQLLAFARRQVIAPVPLDLAEVLRSAEKLLRRVLREDVSLLVEASAGLWPVLGDPGQLEQVLLNLAMNARDAMPAGGTLTIVARNEEPNPAGGGEGQWVRLSVQDTGGGMSPEVRAHLFEPFFTTKAQGKGTGLGLAMVHGIVAQSGGRIEVQTEVDRGTTFHLFLPRTAQVPIGESQPMPTPASRGSETILVIEDEPQVRGVTVRALEGAGYRVLVASSGAEALQGMRAAGERVDLVVTDVVMPGLSGPEAVDELRRLQPALRVLYVSGYAEEAMAQRGIQELGMEFLAKPFTAASLLSRVRQLMDGRPGPS